jgi:hypothetical protein
MAFILHDHDHDHLDRVTFHVKKYFSDNPCTITHYIDRRDEFALPYYIKKYMETNVAIRRPDTPAKLIVQTVPKFYSPPL